MEMRLASVNLDSVDLKSLQGIKQVYPLPMPVLAKKSSEDLFLVYSLVNQMDWVANASLNSEIDISKKTSIPLEIPTGLFKKYFKAIGDDVEGSGIYAKIPSPVISLKVEVPCSYRNGEAIVSVSPNDVVIQTKAGNIKHFSQNDFDRLFISDIRQVKDMQIKFIRPERNNNLDLSM